MFKNLLGKIQNFKYQITVEVLLSKQKRNGGIEFSPVYFNSTIKTVINFEYHLDKSFQVILYRIDNWINEGSGWVIESIDAEYMNISIYSPLSRNSYIELSRRLKNSMNGLLNIKNNDNKCFLRCHIRHLNPLKRHLERIAIANIKMVDDLNYEYIEFHVSIKDY